MFRRVLAAAVTVIAAGFLLACAWPQLFGLEKAPIVAQIVSLRGLAIAVALGAVVALTLIALLSVSARRLAASVALLLLVFTAVSGAVLSTRGFGNTAFQATNGRDLTVLTWNTLGDAPGAEVIAKLALDSAADIIALPETTEPMGVEIAGMMGEAGHPMWVYTIAYDRVSKARSTTLLISVTLGEYSVDETLRTTSVLPSVVATPADGAGPTIIAVHPVAPIPGEMTNWRSDLEWLAATCAGDNVIMAGDFNSTIDHYDGLNNSNSATLGDCTDAALASDTSAVGTGPTALPALLGAPIDHVMFTANWRVTGMRVIETHDKFGSDHRPVVVQLSPSG